MTFLTSLGWVTFFFIVVVCLFDINEIKNSVIGKPRLQFFVFLLFYFFLLAFCQYKLRHKEQQKENKTKTTKKKGFLRSF